MLADAAGMEPREPHPAREPVKQSRRRYLTAILRSVRPENDREVGRGELEELSTTVRCSTGQRGRSPLTLILRPNQPETDRQVGRGEFNELSTTVRRSTAWCVGVLALKDTELLAQKQDLEVLVMVGSAP